MTEQLKKSATIGVRVISFITAALLDLQLPPVLRRPPNVACLDLVLVFCPQSPSQPWRESAMIRLVPSLYVLFFLWRQISTHTFKHFGCHTNGLAKCRMRVNSLANIGWVTSHLDGERDFTDQITRVRADDTAADDAMRF